MYLANKVLILTFQKVKSYFLDKKWTLEHDSEKCTK